MLTLTISVLRLTKELHLQNLLTSTTHLKHLLTSYTHLPSSTNIPPQPKRHVVFAKVHKAASTTMHSIFMRYAFRHDLDPVLNLKGIHIEEDDYKMPRGFLYKPSRGQTYDILCSHILFNVTEISPYFPHDTIYIGILRKPFPQFLSAFAYYFRKKNEFFSGLIRDNTGNPVEQFLNNTDYYLQVFQTKLKPDKSKINNRMSVDLGIRLENFEQMKKNSSFIQEFIERVDKTFSLMLLSERFLESLVLMRRILGWTTQDVVFIKKNALSHHGKPSWVKRKRYSDHVQARFDQWAAFDVALYRHFERRLTEKMNSQSADFHQEVQDLERLTRGVSHVCSRAVLGATHDTLVTFPATEWSSEVTLTTDDCHTMNMEEIELVRKAKIMQRMRYFSSHDDTSVIQ